MQLPSLLAEAWGVAIGQGPGDRGEHDSPHQRLPVVSLDRLVALLTGEPVARFAGVSPPDSGAPAKVAGHGEHHSWSNIRSYVGR